MMQMEHGSRYFQKVFPYMNLWSGQEKFPFIRTVGVFESYGGFRWKQVSPDCVIHAITRGRGWFEVRGKGRWMAEAGDLFIFSIGDTIHYYDEAGHPWSYLWFTIGGAGYGDVLREIGISPDMPLYSLGVSHPFFSAADMVLREFRRVPHHILMPSRCFWNLTGHLAPEGTEDDSPLPGLAVRVKREIENRRYGYPRVEELARQHRVDRSTLYRAFRKEFGISLKSFIQEQQMRKACRLLEIPEYSICNAAEAAGFEDARYFSRIFRKTFNKTPSEWRKDKPGF